MKSIGMPKPEKPKPFSAHFHFEGQSLAELQKAIKGALSKHGGSDKQKVRKGFGKKADKKAPMKSAPTKKATPTKTPMQIAKKKGSAVSSEYGRVMS